MPAIVSKESRRGTLYNIAVTDHQRGEWLKDHGYYATIAYSVVESERVPREGYADSPASLRTLCESKIDERLEDPVLA